MSTKHDYLLGSVLLALIGGLCLSSRVHVQAQASSAHWVFFADRPDSSERALAARAAELDPHAVARRMRALGRPVDADDLLPSAGYVRRVESLGVTIRKQSRWLNAVSVEATEAQLQMLRALPEVSRITPVVHYYRKNVGDEGPTGTTSEPEPNPVSELRPSQAQPAVEYGRAAAQLMLLGAPAAHSCGLTGKGVVVGILDSGFLTTHAALKNVKVLGARDFVKNDDVVANEPGDPADQHGHGTSCLSLIAGWDPGNFVGGAYEVSVLLAKTEDTAREVKTEEDNYVAGLEWAESKGADIATSSLGYSDWWKPADFDGKTAPSSIAVGAAVKRGLICLTATGNEGPNAKTLGVPSDAVGVLSIGAVNMMGRIANFSSRGPTADGRMKPEFVAPGQAVTVARASGGYMTGSGTSFATPLAAAMVALLVQAKPGITPQEVADLLKGSAVANGAPDSVYGYGRIDIAKATAPLCQCADGDGDGARNKACGGTDCKDDDAKVNPAATEVCSGGVDENCDGLVDAADPSCKGAAGSGGMVAGVGGMSAAGVSGMMESVAGASGISGMGMGGQGGVAATPVAEQPVTAAIGGTPAAVANTSSTSNALSIGGMQATVAVMTTVPAPPPPAAAASGCSVTGAPGASAPFPWYMLGLCMAARLRRRRQA